MALILTASAVWGSAQPASIDFHHVYTFGSKGGIHPPRLLNRNFAKTALGSGEHPYGLAFPVGVITDQRQRVWITDSGTASVHVFDRATGAYQEIRRAGDYALQQPSGITIDGGGRIYVADSGNGGVFVFDDRGEYDRALVKPGSHLIEHPTAVALSSDEKTVYVADPPKNVVIAINREGEVNGTIPLPGDVREPAVITVIHNQVYVLGGQAHKIAGFSPSGLRRGALSWDDVQFPSAFTFDEVRRWFLVANPAWGTIQIFDEEGRGLSAFGQRGEGVDQTQKVDALYVDRKGLVYVVDSHEGKVLVFTDSPQP